MKITIPICRIFKLRITLYNFNPFIMRHVFLDGAKYCVFQTFVAVCDPALELHPRPAALDSRRMREI